MRKPVVCGVNKKRNRALVVIWVQVYKLHYTEVVSKVKLAQVRYFDTLNASPDSSTGGKGIGKVICKRLAKKNYQITYQQLLLNQFVNPDP